MGNLGFLDFLLETDSLKQKRALLKNSTHGQLRALSQVCNHLLTKHCKLGIRTGKRSRKKLILSKKL